MATSVALNARLLYKNDWFDWNQLQPPLLTLMSNKPIACLISAGLQFCFNIILRLQEVCPRSQWTVRAGVPSWEVWSLSPVQVRGRPPPPTICLTTPGRCSEGRQCGTGTRWWCAGEQTGQQPTISVILGTSGQPLDQSIPVNTSQY